MLIMKTKLIALCLALFVPVAAFADGDHAHGHAHAKKITGPNKGRVLTEIEPHAELFVTAERKLRLTFIDDAGNPVATPAGLVATVITGERAAPVTLNFAADGASLLSTAPLPEGGNLPAIVRIKAGAEAKLVTIRVRLNLAKCGECDRQEYACACAH
jgi:hypothetical protein